MKEIIKKSTAFFGRIEQSEWMMLFFTLATFFLILALLILGITSLIPKTKVEVKISGPEKAKVGEWITYTVTIKNSGNVILTNPELVFNYPITSLPENNENNLIETVKLADFFYPKQEKVLEFKARLFGQEGQKQEVKAWLNYSTKRKQEVAMSKVAVFYTTLSEVPIDLILELPPKISIFPKKETEFNFRIRYLSLIDPPISNLKLVMELPKDFELKESKPSKVKEKEFEIPALSKGESGEIEIWGSFPVGEPIGKELNFKNQLFINLRGKDILLKEVSVRSLTFEPTFIFSQKINGREDYVANPGEKLHYQVYFKNIQDKPLRDLTLTVVLEGELFDLFTIEAPEGEFRSGDNSISWDEEKISSLRYLTPGQEGEVEFWVKLKADYKPETASETNVLIRNRVLLAGFEKEFRNKVNSKLEISQEGYYRDKYNFFTNTGPYPPKVGETTTYTIVWKIKNYYNWIKDVKIEATLPPQVQVKSQRANRGEIKITRESSERKSVYPGIPANFRFEKPLHYGMTSVEVRYLQIILNKEGVFPNKVTGYFGHLTFEAVKKFQEKYQEEILLPQNLSAPTGYIDELTRLKLNELLAKGIPSGITTVVWEAEKVDAGVGILTDPWIAAFQIAFTPDLTQKDKMGILVNEVTMSATDQWTGIIVSAKDESIDTSLPDDTSTSGEGKIR